MRWGLGFAVRLRIVVCAALGLMVMAPSGGRAEAFSSYWSTLSESERAFVDQVAAGIYAEERGKRIDSFERLNSATKARLRARAVETLGVENRPARSNRKGADI
ncbi:MAG: hypothetical protein ACOZAA_17380 [Pseudomonadota bacterium]